MPPLPTRPAADQLPGAIPSDRRRRSGRPHRHAVVAAGSAAVMLLVGACGGGSAGADTSGSTSTVASAPSSTAATESADAELTVTAAWVKATAGAQDASMTAAFGVLTNATDRPVTVVSATTSASDRAELHEMAMIDGSMVMRPKAGGFVIPAGGSTTLQPGGEHVMIMDIADAIKPGDQITVTLTLDDGSMVDFTALAKDFAGAQEEYAGPSGATSAGAMQMPGGTTTSPAHG